ncbi:hypothetical protein POTOM_023215 [Populus tomentosa]|uniref:Nuclear pore complex protein NUP205 n=2 Tax=Populus TaxID=3689 RepID=A0A8X7ZJ26_POPTO|nr:hypothetical protein POTOM_023215 [Populus tomentosa]
MASPKQLLSTIESTLLNSSPPSAAERVELMHAIRRSLPSLQALLFYPPPKPSDRAQVVQSKEVRLPDSPAISLDDQDVQIALKLSDDLHLNEIECVRLLVSANQEWGLMAREPLEILRLAAGLCAFLGFLNCPLQAVVLDRGLEDDIISDIQKYLEDLINGGLRQRLISLIKVLLNDLGSGNNVVGRSKLISVWFKELNLEEPAGFGGPLCEHYVLDSRGALVERQAVITFSLLFSLVIAFISDALSAVPDKGSILSHDASFRKEFHEIVMAAGNNPNVEGFVGVVRLAWCVHLMLINDAVSASSSNNSGYVNSCLEFIFSHNVFQFLLDNILRTAAYQNDDEDMIYMYNAYMHKLTTCLLSHQLVRDKVKESKDKAMSTLNSYRLAVSQDLMHDSNPDSQQATETGHLLFVSLLEFVSEIYKKEPELLSGNDVLWTFVNFAGEDHTNFQTLVAFLKMLSALASSQEGAAKVYELLQGNAFRSVGWSTLFDCLTIYDEKFKQSVQTTGTMLPEFQEGDAKALVAYLDVLQKVIENGNPVDRKNWFPDIEPLFKLLSYENVPPYLKGALRNAIATFVHVSPVLKDAIWSYLEQYDLPVVVGAQVGNIAQPTGTQVYDMQYELNEIEARRERYPSTISFLNLLNTLIGEEKDVSDRGRRFIGIFRFICDHVFGPFPQRAYADPCEKWQLVVSCLQHFHMMLSMYEIEDEDIDSFVDLSQLSTVTQPSSLQMQLPVLELLKVCVPLLVCLTPNVYTSTSNVSLCFGKVVGNSESYDFMSGRIVFRNIMGILLPGVNSIITERTSQIYGQLLEKAVQLSLEIIILVLEKDLLVSDYWRPLYQPLDVILSQDHNLIVALLEYVRYDFLPKIQQCSIKIMSILSSRVVGLVQLLLKSNAANSLVEDYAACLEVRSEECQIIENKVDDPGVLIMQLLIDNISRPAPNVTHLLLKFDIDHAVEQTVLQPKFHYSCLKVILEILDRLLKPEKNAILHEFGFQLLYELSVDPLTCGPTMDLLSKKKYQFFVKHLDTIGIAPLPKRNSNQPLRISSLHQRAWLLKLLAVELHSGYMGGPSHREACQTILAHLFGRDVIESGSDHVVYDSVILRNGTEHAGTQTISKNKVLELLEVIQFRSPDTTMKLSQIVSNMKYDLMAEDILGDPRTSGRGGIYYYSERGDRLIDLASFRDKLWQKFNSVYPQLSNFGNEAELNDVRETIQQLLRWGWKYNKNLEEQAAQLHMLTGWSHIVEVSASRRIHSLENRSEILYRVLDASLSASASQDCSLRMAFVLSQVALTCMAKLRDERFLCSGGLNSDNMTCLDVITAKKLSNGACHSILFKLIMAILRNESSEALRRRQYALLLGYFQYCQHMLDPNIPTTVMQFLMLEEQDSEDLDFQKIDKDQAELARTNFSIMRKESQAILDLVINDATKGSEPGKTIALFKALWLLVNMNRGRREACAGDDSHGQPFIEPVRANPCSQYDYEYSSGEEDREMLMRVRTNTRFDYQRRVSTIEPRITLVEKGKLPQTNSKSKPISFTLMPLKWNSKPKAQKAGGKDGGHSLDSLQRASTLEAELALLLRISYKYGKSGAQVLFSMGALEHLASCRAVSLQGCLRRFDRKLRRDVSVDFDKQCMIVTPMLRLLFSLTSLVDTSDIFEVKNKIVREVIDFVKGHQLLFDQILREDISTADELTVEQINLVVGILCKVWPYEESDEFGFVQGLFSMMRALFSCDSGAPTVGKLAQSSEVSDSSIDYHSPAMLQQPTLMLLDSLLRSVATSLEMAADEKSLLLNKIQDINELSRQEVDEIINMCAMQESVSSSDDIQKRRYIAMMEMSRVAGERDQLITLLLPLAEHVLDIILVHFREGSMASDNSGVTKAVTFGTHSDPRQDLSWMCGMLVPTLERLELLSEDKVGHNLKVFRRLVTSLKEMAIQNLAL